MILELPIVTVYPRKSANARLRDELWLRDRHCAYCRRRVRLSRATIDHKLPRSRGGATDDRNCVLCCRRCNLIKGHLTASEFAALLLAMAQQARRLADPVCEPPPDGQEWEVVAMVDAMSS